jgi:hypothetical protein
MDQRRAFDMATATTNQTAPPRAARPDGAPSTWVYLRDLPLPPEKEDAVIARCRSVGGGKEYRRWSLEQAKLWYHFPDLCVVIRETDKGVQVMLAAENDSPELPKYYDALTPDLRMQAVCHYLETRPQVRIGGLIYYDVDRPADDPPGQ